MPVVPPTRSKKLRRPDQDPIQWKLTKQNEKTIQSTVIKPQRAYANSTIDVGKAFVALLSNQSNKKDKIHAIIQDINHLHATLAFSPKMFVGFAIDQASDLTVLLQVYYELSIQLEILALPLRLILSCIEDLDEPLCELFFVHEEIGEAYIKAMDETMMNNFFVQDGKLFLEWSASMKRERVNRFKYILSNYSETMRKDQCMNQLLRLRTTSFDDFSKHLYRELRKTKELIFMPSKISTKQADTMMTKSIVFDLFSEWFYEYNSQSNLKLVEYAIEVCVIKNDNKQSASDICLIFHTFSALCKRLSMEGKDVLRISDIIAVLNDEVNKLLEGDHPEGLSVILTLAQIAFDQMCNTVGYSFAQWFDTTFVNTSTSILNKRMGTIFIKILQQFLPYEIPSVLQTYGKALQHCTTLNNASVYFSAVKRRLLELGVDSSFRHYPQTLKLPIQSTILSVDDEVTEVIQQYRKRNAIPQSLLSSSVFKRQWFDNTFVPKLLSWNGQDIAARDALIEALRQAKKIR